MVSFLNYWFNSWWLILFCGVKQYLKLLRLKYIWKSQGLQQPNWFSGICLFYERWLIWQWQGALYRLSNREIQRQSPDWVILNATILFILNQIYISMFCRWLSVINEVSVWTLIVWRDIKVHLFLSIWGRISFLNHQWTIMPSSCWE